RVAASVEAPHNTQGPVAASSVEAPSPSTSTATAPNSWLAGEQVWQVVQRKETPSDMRKKNKRTEERKKRWDQQNAGRKQPPAARQGDAKKPLSTPIAAVGARQPNRQGDNQGERGPNTEQAALTSGPAEVKTNAHRKPRRRRGGRGQGNALPATQQGDVKVPKRPRPNETQSPQVQVKKQKASTSVVSARGAATYADKVVLNDLFVAVMAEPFTDLSPTHVEAITSTLESCIIGLADAPSGSNNIPYVPAFHGKPFHSEGVLKMHCEDSKAVEWLKETVATLESPIPGTILVVRRQKDIPKRVKSAVLLPACNEEIGTIQRVLICQNRGYQVSRWSLYSTERQEGNTPGTFLVLGIPADEIPNIMARGRRLCYKLGNAYIRFFGNKGRLQEMPPDQVETAPTSGTSSDPSAAKQKVRAGKDLVMAASVSTANQPIFAERQSAVGEPMVTQHSSAERQRQDGMSVCSLTTTDGDASYGDLEEAVAHLADQDIPLGTDEEVSSPLRSSSPH
ncbi:hypothetical protein O3G_MSEX000483, partial [Manduca sexta]